MLEKILVKSSGLVLVVLSITIVVKLIMIEYDEDLIILANYLFITTIALISLVLGVALLLAKVSKKTVSEENKNNRKDEADDK